MDIVSSGPAVGGGILVDEIEKNFSKFVNIKGVQETCASGGEDTINVEEEQEDFEPCGREPVRKALQNSAKLLSEEVDEPETALPLLFSDEGTQPALPLVSAMKGSREKLGAPPRKLTVSWAPNVYDPVPNSLSHTVKGKQKKSRKDRDGSGNYKKNGKKGQKGNSKGGKDKKQFRKSSGSGRLDKCYKAMNTYDAPEGFGEFDVGGPDYCGSSFLKKSPIKFHYGVAEAL